MTEPLPKLPPRDVSGHKGTFGTVAVFGGSAGIRSAQGIDSTRMIGAPALAARAALRAGCGLARIATPEDVLDAALAACPSATGAAIPTDESGRIVPHLAAEVFDREAGAADALVVGPGLGSGDAVESLVLRAVQQDDVPLVLDADGLNALAAIGEFASDLRAPTVLTPHPGEYRRLADALKISADPVDESSRPAACEQLAQRLGSIVVLKGAGTIVSDGHRTWCCERGHPCLATGGSGDVLGGLIAGLIAQFVAPGPAAIGNVQMPRPPGKPLNLFDAARIGVEAHAIAGERWAAAHAASAGLLADELADELPAVLEAMRG